MPSYVHVPQRGRERQTGGDKHIQIRESELVNKIQRYLEHQSFSAHAHNKSVLFLFSLSILFPSLVYVFYHGLFPYNDFGTL